MPIQCLYYTLFSKRPKLLYLKIYISVNFEANKNPSYSFVPTIKTKLSVRGIRKNPKIGPPVLTIQKWRCLSEQHHGSMTLGSALSAANASHAVQLRVLI